MCVRTFVPPPCIIRVGVSSNLIYEQLRKGVLPSVRLGGRILIPVDAVEQMMERQEQRETLAKRGYIGIAQVWGHGMC